MLTQCAHGSQNNNVLFEVMLNQQRSLPSNGLIAPQHQLPVFKPRDEKIRRHIVDQMWASLFFKGEQHDSKERK